MCNTCGCKSAENFEAKPYGDYHKRDFYTVAHGKTEEPRFAEVHETFETWDEAYKEANRLSRFTDGEYVFVFSPKDASPYVIEPQNKDYFGAYDDSISERQEWLIGELGGKVDKSMNRSKASDYIKELQGKESGTWKDAETFEATGISDFTVMFMLGYLDQATFVDAVRNNDISASELKRYVNKLNNAFGGYEGLLQYFNLYDTEGEDVANFFDTQMKETYKRGGNTYTQYYDFDDDYTKEQFMENYRTSKMSAEGESKRKGSHAPNIQLVNYEDVLREKMKNQNMKDAETFEANEESVEQTDANMVNEGSVEAFYGGGAKVSVSSAGIQPTANPSVDEAFNVGNQVGLDVAEQEIMNENPSVEVNYGAEESVCDTCGSEGKNPNLMGGYCDGCVCSGCGDRPISGPSYSYCERCYEEDNPSHENWDRSDYWAETDMSLRESAKLGFGVGAGLLGFNVALLGIATIGGFLLNRD